MSCHPTSAMPQQEQTSKNRMITLLECSAELTEAFAGCRNRLVGLPRLIQQASFFIY